jgi:hypothetical protein
MNFKRMPKSSYVYLKKVYYWRRNSTPFLSGDLFADNSDISFYSPLFRRKHPEGRLIREARVIFCPSHKLEDFLSEYGSMVTAKVLILGNSDRDFNEFDFRLPNSIKAVFAQNLNMVSNELHVLPIGIENLRLGVNGTPWLFRNNPQTELKLNKVLVGPFSSTHIERLAFQSLLSSDQITVVEERMSPFAYSKFASYYRFVVAPRGNGLDTHRFWEASYRGSVPLTRKSDWSRMVGNLGIPLIEVEDYSENSLIRAINNFQSENFTSDRIASLWWPYWKERFRKFL